MLIKHLDELIDMAKQRQRKRLVVACAEDETVISAIYQAWKENIIIPIFSGNKNKILGLCKKYGFPTDNIEILDTTDDNQSVKQAIRFINEGKGHMLMKGLVSTATLLKAVLAQDEGLLKETILSHFALFESPFYHKLLGVTDAAVNISPTAEEKKTIISNAVDIFQKLDIQNPKVALIGPVEKVNPKIQSTIDAEILTQMNRNGEIKGCVLEGPLALDNAISGEAAIHKGITSIVAGDADLLVAHNLDAANILYKAINFLGGGKCAAMILGAKVPVILTSRADDEKTKLLSIALGCVVS